MSFLIGTICSLVVVFVTMRLLGASPAEFLDMHALVVVVFGSMAATATAYSFKHLFKPTIYFMMAMLPFPMKDSASVMDIKRMADKASPGGRPSLTS